MCLSEDKLAQEYFINAQNLENRVRELLPSQAGFGAGFDLSASTQIVPIIDLTESASGSDVRADLQTALSFGSQTAFDVENTTTTIINTTGYYRIIGTSMVNATAGAQHVDIILNDGVTDKVILAQRCLASSGISCIPVDITVFLGAGDSVKVEATGNAVFQGSHRQIATISGELVSP